MSAGWQDALARLRALLDEADRSGRWTAEQFDEACTVVRTIYAVGLLRARGCDRPEKLP